MKNLSLNAKIIFVLSIFVVASISISVLGISKMGAINESAKSIVEQDAKRLSIAMEIRALFLIQLINEKNAILETNKDEKGIHTKRTVDRAVQLKAELQKYREMAQTEAGRQNVADLEALYADWTKNNEQAVALSMEGKTEAATEISMVKQREIRLKFEKLADDMVDRNAKFMADKLQKSAEDYAEARLLVIVISAVAIFVGLLLAFFVMRAVSRAIDQVIANLTDNSNQVTSAAQQIAASSEQLSQAATEQASALEETAASIEEMSSMVQKNSENAKKSTDVSGSSQTSAEKGKQVVREMINAIDGINASNNDIMGQINESNQQISEIVKVISEIGNKTKVINDIVFQTKLLSFNASVEAARAGEHGKGFAVVAEEVGNLAQMSGNAAKEISAMLEGSIQKVEGIVTDTKTKVERLVAVGKEKVETGTQVAQQCGQVLDEIVQGVATVGQMVTEISTACQEQAQGVQEITKAMGQMDQMTQQNAATSEEAASAAEELSAQAEALGGVVRVLVETVKGSQGGSPVTAAARKVAASPSRASGNGSGNVVHVKNEWGQKNQKSGVKAAPLKLAAGAEDRVPSESDPRFKDV